MKKYMSLASFVTAIVFAAVGMAIPPKGVIDGSVLILAAQLFVLCATFLGVDGYVNILSRKKPNQP